MIHKLALLLILVGGRAQGVENPIEIAFTTIYSSNEWGKDENGNGTSGDGSTIEQTIQYVDFLTEFLRHNKIKSVVDVGCGDWQFSQFIDWQSIDYTGYDVVKSVIESNIKNFSTPHITFIHGNAVSIDLPQADLLICKDVLQHLSNQVIKKFLEQTSKFKYCLITNDCDPSSPRQNVEGVIGGWRPLDLSKPPFSKVGRKIFEYPSGITTKQVFLMIKKPKAAK